MRKLKIGCSTLGCDQGKSGIGRYFQQVLRALEPEAERNGHQIEILLFKSEAEFFLEPDSRVIARFIPAIFRFPVLSLIWNFIFLPLICVRQGYDIFFLPAANRRIPLYCPCPLVGTIHDFSALHIADKYDFWRMIYIKKILPILFRSLKAVFTVSESSKKDLIDYGKISSEQIIITPNAVDINFAARPEKSFSQELLQKKYAIDKPFILYVSRIEHPGKNHWGLIEAYNFLKKEYQIEEDLVFVGALKERSAEVLQFAAQSPWAKQIHFTDYLTDIELRSFYAEARVMVFPSFFEGFGIPVLEAMAFSLPVCCADNSSLPEVAGAAALYFDPHNYRDMAVKIWQLLNDADLAADLQVKGLQRCQIFSWAESAKRIIAAMEKICYNEKNSATDL